MMEPHYFGCGQLTVHLGAAVVFGVTFLVARWYLSGPRLPPGPLALPLIGSLLWLRGDVREYLRGLALYYGDVFTVYIGSKPVIFVAHHQTVKEALQRHGRSLIDRPEQAVLQLSQADLDKIREAAGVTTSPDNQMWRGVLEASGETWRQQRIFLHAAFRRLGVGTADYEPVILEECTHMIQALLHEDEKGPFDPHLIVMKAITNVMHRILYGFRCKYEEERCIQLVQNTQDCFKVLGTVGPTMTFPILKYIPGDLFGWNHFMDTMCKQLRSFKKDLKDAKKTWEPGSNRCLIDLYVDEIDRRRHDPKSTFDEHRLLATMGNLFGAGSETTTTTLLWAILYLLRFPDVSEKLRLEVDTVIGRGRSPSMKDRLNMPYTEACILEIQRIADILPLNPPRYATQDVTLSGCTITAGSTVVFLWYSVHRDLALWRDPYVFRPERFLDKDGHVFGRERIMPFSQGRRNCLGESLAKMVVFLFIASMMQQLLISAPDGSSPPDLHGLLGLTYAPKPFKIIVKSRK